MANLEHWPMRPTLVPLAFNPEGFSCFLSQKIWNTYCRGPAKNYPVTNERRGKHMEEVIGDVLPSIRTAITSPNTSRDSIDLHLLELEITPPSNSWHGDPCTSYSGDRGKPNLPPVPPCFSKRARIAPVTGTPPLFPHQYISPPSKR